MSRERGPDLTEGARAEVDIDGGEGPIGCTVLAFLGPVILARYEDPLGAETVEQLSGEAAGYLLLEHARGVKALRCRASTSGAQTLALRIVDAFQLGQRRESTRVEIALDAELVPEGVDGSPTSTRTVDVSLGGVRVKRPADTPLCERYAVTLSGRPLDAPVPASAALARALPDALALRFTHIEAADRRRLIALMLARLAADTSDDHR